jgi:hypothetical protein
MEANHKHQIYFYVVIIWREAFGLPYQTIRTSVDPSACPRNYERLC